MVRWDLIFAVVVIALSMFLCSGVLSHYAGDSYWTTKQAGIGAGILHGIIAPVMLIYSLFSNFRIYELNNKGWFYDLGFVLGFLLTWTVGKSTQGLREYYRERKEKKEETKNIEKVAEKVVAKKLNEHEKTEEKEKKTIIIENRKVKRPVRKSNKTEEITI
jgi:hypothetical protein